MFVPPSSRDESPGRRSHLFENWVLLQKQSRHEETHRLNISTARGYAAWPTQEQHLRDNLGAVMTIEPAFVSPELSLRSADHSGSPTVLGRMASWASRAAASASETTQGPRKQTTRIQPTFGTGPASQPWASPEGEDGHEARLASSGQSQSTQSQQSGLLQQGNFFFISSSSDDDRADPPAPLSGMTSGREVSVPHHAAQLRQFRLRVQRPPEHTPGCRVYQSHVQRSYWEPVLSTAQTGAPAWPVAGAAKASHG